MVILSIETSSRIGSVALGFGSNIATEAFFSDIMRHSAEIFPALCKLCNDYSLKPEDIQQLYISNGPGSFTGLRIAATIAKTMHLANKVKIVAVNTLDVIASNALDFIKDKANDTKIERVAAILDAKRGQFFIAAYDIINGSEDIYLKKITPDSLMTSSEFIGKYVDNQKSLWLLGDGLVFHKKLFTHEYINFCDEQYWRPKASKVYEIGWKTALENQFTDPVKLKPFYLCRPDIHVKQR